MIVFLLFGTCFISSSLTQTVNYDPNSSGIFNDGQILYAPMWGTTTYLIDNTGKVNHTWPSSYFPGVAVWWLGDGTILRTIRVWCRSWWWWGWWRCSESRMGWDSRMGFSIQY